jgi:hypothetical protein
MSDTYPELNLRNTLIQYLNGETVQYKPVFLKIHSSKKDQVVVSDYLGNSIKLYGLDHDLRDQLSTLKPFRVYGLRLNSWHFIIKRIPGQDSEFFFDINAKSYQ